jgi:hypothetical protein
MACAIAAALPVAAASISFKVFLGSETIDVQVSATVNADAATTCAG